MFDKQKTPRTPLNVEKKKKKYKEKAMRKLSSKNPHRRLKSLFSFAVGVRLVDRKKLLSSSASNIKLEKCYIFPDRNSKATSHKVTPVAGLPNSGCVSMCN